MISIHPKRIKEPEAITRGLLLHKAGDWSRAMDVYADVLSRHPRHAVALYLMAILFEAINEPLRAVTLLSKVVDIKPSFTEAHYNLGVCLQWLGRLEEARASYERALQCNPRFAAAHVNLGNVLMAFGEYDAAIRAYDRATDLAPGGVEGRNNRSFVHLVRGHWAEGWADYETRWELPGHAAANEMPTGVPWWQGEPLAGRSITLVHEQGVGDTLMMLRYVPALERMGAHVILRVPQSLGRLCRVSFPEATVDAHECVGIAHRGNEAPWRMTDYVLPFMSLPHRFGTTVETVPMWDRPYLMAPSEGPTLPPREGFRVGFVWKGSKDHKNDRNRSTSLKDWVPLLTIPGVAWTCLQQEMTAPERAVIDKLPNVACVSGLRDWGETAHVLTQLDALIAVDTGITHLSGAMGLTTCVLISATPDFRHLLAPRTDSVWYDNTRLFRQPSFRDWKTPITEIGARLMAIVADYDQGRAA